MPKLNLKSVMFVLVIASFILLAGCSKPECEASSDCNSRTCQLSRCDEGKCAYTPQSNCCGNRMNDTFENGRSGNKCTCPQDYGKCEGKAKVKIGSKIADAAYAHYYCDASSECVLGIERTDITPQNVLDTINMGYFKATSVLKYSKPFDLSRDIFELRLTLDDTKDLKLPVEITGIKILYIGDHSRSELLIADKLLDASLNAIGDSAAINVPLNLGYKPQEVEETGSIRYAIEYAYTKRLPSGKSQNGIPIYKEEIAREKFTSPAKPVFFVRAE